MKQVDIQNYAWYNEKENLFWEIKFVVDIISHTSSNSSFGSVVKLKRVIRKFKSDDWDVSEHLVTSGLNIHCYIDFYFRKQSQSQDTFARTLNGGYRVIDFDSKEI